MQEYVSGLNGINTVAVPVRYYENHTGASWLKHELETQLELGVVVEEDDEPLSSATPTTSDPPYDFHDQFLLQQQQAQQLVRDQHYHDYHNGFLDSHRPDCLQQQYLHEFQFPGGRFDVPTTTSASSTPGSSSEMEVNLVSNSSPFDSNSNHGGGLFGLGRLQNESPSEGSSSPSSWTLSPQSSVSFPGALARVQQTPSPPGQAVVRALSCEELVEFLKARKVCVTFIERVRREKYDGETFLDITVRDLEKYGIEDGPQKRILNIIKESKRNSGVLRAIPVSHSPLSPPPFSIFYYYFPSSRQEKSPEDCWGSQRWPDDWRAQGWGRTPLSALVSVPRGSPVPAYPATPFTTTTTTPI